MNSAVQVRDSAAVLLFSARLPHWEEETEMLKKIMAAALAVATLGAAAPALADDHRRDDRWDRRDERWDRRDDRRDHRIDRRDHRWDDRAGYVGRRGDRLDWRIDQGVRSGRLTRGEAARLYAELNWIASAERRASRNGLSRWEREEIDRRYDRLADRVRWEKRDGDRRFDDRYGYGYGHRR